MATREQETKRFSADLWGLSPGADSRLDFNDDVLKAFDRHEAGDWGEVDEERRHKNEEALKKGNGARIVSIYRSSNGLRFLLVSPVYGEPERRWAKTLVLLEEEADKPISVRGFPGPEYRVYEPGV